MRNGLVIWVCSACGKEDYVGTDKCLLIPKGR